MIHHEKMVRDGVVAVAVPSAGGRGGIGLSPHLLIENAVAQRLGRLQFVRRAGDPEA